MITLSSHVLDTTNGKPASGLSITLTTPEGRQIDGSTDQDGRCKDWGDIVFKPGIYQMRFHSKAYLLTHYENTFYPFVDIHFEMRKEGGHYHVPLLISPFGFSSYRGS